MKTYALIQSGVVHEIIPPVAYDTEPSDWKEGDQCRVGQEIPVGDRFSVSLVDQMVDVTEVTPAPSYGWVYEGQSFLPPVPYQPSEDEVKTTNAAVRDSLLANATLAMAPLQDAIDLDEATAEEVVRLKSWKQYRVAVNRIELTLVTPAWPTSPA